jgi:ferritin-like metal-binding protein YciE
MASNNGHDGTRLVVRYLNEAHATEGALVTTLTAHLSITPPGSYRKLLERHLAETREHAEAIERRLSELGATTSVIQAGTGLVQTAIGQVLALSKGPIDLLRGGSREEKLLKNAKDECATEALEIATYDALEALARAVGDDQTASLARRHRAQEERMLEGLRAELPGLTKATAKSLAADAVQPSSRARTPSRAPAPRRKKSQTSTTLRSGSST